jgi:type I restriction enzyme S subunit
MKYSGVTWLGDIPEHWEVAPLKTAFTRVKRPPLVGAGIVTAFRDGEVTLRSNRRSEGYTEADDYSGYQRIMPSDLAIHSMDAFAGAIGVSDSDGICSPVLSVCVAKNQNDPRYMAYQLRLMSKRGWIEALSRSVRERTSEFRWAEAGKQKVALPPIEEQKAIADFLDGELTRIDELVNRQQAFISLLEERQSSLCHQVINTGLGQEWGTPSNWSKNRVSRLFKAAKGPNAAQLSIEYCSTVPGPYPVYSGQTENGGVMAQIDSFAFDSGEEDVLFTTTVGAKAMTVMTITGKFSLSQNCMVIRNISKRVVDTNYAYWQFKVLFGQKKAEISSHMQASFRMSDLNKFEMLVPSLGEQIAIAEYLNESERSNRLLVKNANELINTLLERRNALINAAVTGKLDVRGKN